MALRKVVSLSSNKDGYIEIESLQAAKKQAMQNIKNKIRTSIYVDWFATDENIEPVKGYAFFTDDECTKLYKRP